MTNEEIVARIQAGEEDLLETLWMQTERLVAWKANRVIRALNGCDGVEFGDLYNSCFPALIEAVETYTPNNGLFSTWFMFYIKTAFAEATGYRTVRARNDPIQNYVSFYAPIGENDDGGTLSDVTPDPQGELTLISAEARIMLEQIQGEIDQALSQIPPEQGQILHRHYLENKSLEDISQEMEMTVNDVQNAENKAIRTMRLPKISKKLRLLYEDFDFYGCSNMSSFKRSGMSVQERYLVQQNKQ